MDDHENHATDLNAEADKRRARLTDLIVSECCNFRNLDGSPIYNRVRKQLRRIGATDNCIVCGMPNHRHVLTFAHIHQRDLDLSPRKEPNRVFRLCWHHHHGCSDQGYISTIELLEAEAAWIYLRNRPQPHMRDIELMRRVKDGEVDYNCVWRNAKFDRRPTFEFQTPDMFQLTLPPVSDARRSITVARRSIISLKSHAKRCINVAAKAATATEKSDWNARAVEFLGRAALKKQSIPTA